MSSAALGNYVDWGFMNGCSGKDPSVETHFLPDQDRAVAEINLRAQLKEEWTLRQKVTHVQPRSVLCIHC